MLGLGLTDRSLRYISTCYINIVYLAYSSVEAMRYEEDNDGYFFKYFIGDICHKQCICLTVY